MHILKKIIVHFIASAVAILAADYLFDIYFNIQYSTTLEYIKLISIFVIIFGILNAILKPILKIVSLPLMIITVGLFSIIINAVILWIVTLIMPEVYVHWWQGYLFVPLALSIMGWFAHKIIRVRKKED